MSLSFADLPCELKQQIFDYIRPHERVFARDRQLHTLASTCRDFRCQLASKTSALWIHNTAEHLTVELVARKIESCARTLRFLSLVGFYVTTDWAKSRLVAAINACTRCETLEFTAATGAKGVCWSLDDFEHVRQFSLMPIMNCGNYGRIICNWQGEFPRYRQRNPRNPGAVAVDTTRMPVSRAAELAPKPWVRSTLHGLSIPLCRHGDGERAVTVCLVTGSCYSRITGVPFAFAFENATDSAQKLVRNDIATNAGVCVLSLDRLVVLQYVRRVAVLAETPSAVISNLAVAFDHEIEIYVPASALRAAKCFAPPRALVLPFWPLS